MWKLIGDVKDMKTAGFLRIERDGKRVADLFPFAKNTDPEWIMQQGQEIVDTMNRSQQASGA